MSDSHGKREMIETVLKQAGEIDYFFHLGDVCGSERYIQENVRCPIYMIAGNCDYNRNLEKEQIVLLGEKKILLTHGDKYQVNYGHKRLLLEAETLGMDMVMYGHTHCPEVVCENGIWIINPGSITYPRQEDGHQTYVIMSIEESGECSFEIKNIFEKKY